MEGTGLYAYGFRYYDPASARFTGVDPIADQFAFVSGFNYAENEPIAHIDLHGLQKWRTFFGDISRFLGISNGPINNNAPRSAREADAYAGRRAAVKETMDGVETVVEVQAIFVPGMDALLSAEKGNYDEAVASLGVDIASTFFPPLKGAKAAKAVKAVKAANKVGKKTPNDNLAFGLLSAGLVDFARKFNFKTFREFTSGGFKPKEIKKAIENPSNNLHINLDGISGFRYSLFDPSQPVTLGNITNWEIFTIKNTPGALKRTKFYRKGAEVPSPYWLNQ